MKINAFTKIFALVFCLLIFIPAIFAQEKPRALEIGEFSDNTENIQRMKEKIIEFSKRLTEEPSTTRGFLQVQADEKSFEKVKSIISEADSSERILFEGNLIPKGLIILNFYIIPSGADVPQFCGLRVCECPTLNVSGYESANAQNSPAFIFTANTQGGNEKNVITYVWKVSAGRIVEG